MLYGYKFDGKFSPEEGHYFDPSRILLDPYGKVGDLLMIHIPFLFWFGFFCCFQVMEEKKYQLILLLACSVMDLRFTLIFQAVIRRGEYGTVGPDGNCWPQMACMIPSSDDKVPYFYFSELVLYFFSLSVSKVYVSYFVFFHYDS